jgi:proteasome lid subunit RPN8/RPN11
MGKSRETLERYEQHSLNLDGYERPPRRLYSTEDIVRLHEALEPFIDLSDLRKSVAESRDIYEALRVDRPPRELRALLDTLAAVLRPVAREQIKSPADVAGMLMVEMGSLDQEELRTVLLDTRNRVIGLHTVYKGSLDTSMVRVGEVYKEAIKRNSAALIVVHNHPSGQCDPSPEDILITRQIVEAGKLLSTECLDHLIIGQGRWVSLRERGMGFDK